MKKNLFVIASLAVLAMGCVKEQQPDAGNIAEQAKTTTLKVSVDQTKVAVSEVDGACTWQAGDEIAMWFKTGETPSTDASGNTVVIDEGSRVVFTYVETGVDGKAIFEANDEIPAEYTTVRIAHPAESIAETGALSLPKTYVYNTEKIPVYVRARINESSDTDNQGSITIEGDQIEATLIHNAAVMKFTLHDVPAYAAGLVVETKRANGNSILVTTKFPYKTGYTADPADHSNDVVLYSPVAYNSYPYQVYLVDGDNGVIEGSNKYFKSNEENLLKAGDYIKMPVVDFKKSELRKDYVKVCGVKWAKGNLQCYQDNGDDGFQDGWRIAPAQWHYFNYDLASSTIAGTTYTYDDSKATEMQYENDATQFEHYNFGGLARNARFYSSPGVNYMNPGRELEISGKIFLDSKGETEATDDARFADCGTFTSNISTIWGDVAFWASKGKFRTPKKDEIGLLYNSTKVSKQFGYYDTGDYKVWGVLFTTSLGEQVVNTTDIELTDADIESGLFLPKAGRRKIGDSKVVITVRTQGLYRSSSARWGVEGYTEHATVLQIKPTEVKYGYTLHKTEFTNAVGGLIRPVLVETEE